MHILPEEVDGIYAFPSSPGEDEPESLLVSYNPGHLAAYQDAMRSLNEIYRRFQVGAKQRIVAIEVVYYALFYAWAVITSVCIVLKTQGIISKDVLIWVGIGSCIALINVGFGINLAAFLYSEKKMINNVMADLQDWSDGFVHPLTRQIGQEWSVEWFTYDVVWTLRIVSVDRSARIDSVKRRNATDQSSDDSPAETSTLARRINAFNYYTQEERVKICVSEYDVSDSSKTKSMPGTQPRISRAESPEESGTGPRLSQGSYDGAKNLLIVRSKSFVSGVPGRPSVTDDGSVDLSALRAKAVLERADLSDS